ncbi:spermatogenesis-associated protein 22 [Pundamilia nyererei]|uniref:Spermatogenesis-associated protein 22 n=1 Tax=Pundamilia nyererei TaxID=303518 RepID=A0A9Y3S5K2_9CICH|nr:PREDICTED: spermatogenesis-associated protein 22 [Pundamilia nyererei]XP_005749594.1 PREDICTED: spermatogenesis-associated protein 22 [Pundamilia nyererei]XP_039905842.1 spermatogenesis-associated protein 22 [Simochromis diagramma]XP_039905843.1 spermatogenesis-associated protein 22 [Simochromis diagramma]
MKRQENQAARPTSGCLSVPLFNQKKRNRVPLTALPSENEFFSHSEYTPNTSSAISHNPAGAFGCYQASGSPSGVPQSQQWNRQSNSQSAPAQQYGSNRPAPGPAPSTRAYGPIPHPYKAKEKSSVMGQSSNALGQQDSSSVINFRQSTYQGPRSSESGQSQPVPHTGLSQMGRKSSYGTPSFTHQYSQQSRALPPPVPPPRRQSANAPEPQKNAWKFTNSFEPLRSPFEVKTSSNPQNTLRPTPTQAAFPVKPATEHSLRILTAVIDGMRHWSQFKDKVPYLFEIFATLDSAVTVGRYGAKNFLLRDGKEVVQCVFYENEQVLPRLIRGQVHRCVGNYDRSKDVLMCVSVRPALPSELRNAQEAVKTCDAEMRALVKSLSEV